MKKKVSSTETDKRDTYLQELTETQKWLDTNKQADLEAVKAKQASLETLLVNVS
jgi:hypothetical protein